MKIGVIVGSVRANRFAGYPAQWIADLAAKMPGTAIVLLDLMDFDLPFVGNPRREDASDSKSEEEVARWRKEISACDAFIVTAAEYNHGPTAVLKNAMDSAGEEWHNKPVAFVGYGGVGGARAVEQLRLVAIELRMAPIRNAVHILWPVYVAVAREGKSLGEFEYLNEGANELLAQLMWWARVLKWGRRSHPSDLSLVQ